MAIRPDQVHVRNRRGLFSMTTIGMESTTEDVPFDNSRRGFGVNFDHREQQEQEPSALNDAAGTARSDTSLFASGIKTSQAEYNVT
jgi:hypothetical protein